LPNLRIATWNINSIRLRLPLLKKLVEEFQPDIIALQETKCPDEAMPVNELNALGYPYLHFNGMKGYNGVILLSKLPLIAPNIHNRVNKQDSRHIEASFVMPDKKITLHNLYIPAGGDVPDENENEKFAHKLDFVREMTDFIPQRHKKDEHLIVLGDFNIAPYEHDVWSSKQLRDVVSHTPVERELLNTMLASHDWVDVARLLVPETDKLYSWWSYRNQDWRKSDRGRRLDHIWVTPGLKDLVKDFRIAKDARDWPQPSDHVPVIVDLKL